MSIFWNRKLAIRFVAGTLLVVGCLPFDSVYADEVSTSQTEPNQKPSQKPSQKPDKKPSQKPSQKPDKKPSQKPSQKPDKKPDQKPSQDKPIQDKPDR